MGSPRPQIPLGAASQILKSVFDRLILPEVWAYWRTPGVCGQPWVEECSLLNISMAHLQANSYSWQQSLPDTPLNDPVSTANIMYSAHVASIGLLYEAFSGDATLSTDGEGLPLTGSDTMVAT